MMEVMVMRESGLAHIFLYDQLDNAAVTTSAILRATDGKMARAVGKDRCWCLMIQTFSRTPAFIDYIYTVFISYTFP